MKPLIYAVSHDGRTMDAYKNILAEVAEVSGVSVAGLVTAIYSKKPKVILADLSLLDRSALTSIGSALALEYIPVIIIGDLGGMSGEDFDMKDAACIPMEQMESLLPYMVLQGASFMDRYEELQVCSDTYEVMNEEVRDALEIYVDTRINYSEMGMLQYLDSVYRSNFFLDVCPERLWLLRKKAGHEYVCTFYNLKGIQLVKEIVCQDEGFSFEPFEETGFILNCDAGEYSDITSTTQIMPVSNHENCGQIRHVACFANRDVMVIAMDYNERIRQSDLNILKALSIKADMMVNIKTKVSELEASFVYTMNALARAAEGKDDVTGHHIKRVNLYSGLVAKELGMDRDFISQIEISAQMHDVGKILIPDSVLNKPGKLTEEEYEIIKTHTVFGEKVIGESDHLAMAGKIARHHHEKYDGSGYQDGLKGEGIPLEARIVALGDI